MKAKLLHVLSNLDPKIAAMCVLYCGLCYMLNKIDTKVDHIERDVDYIKWRG